MTIKVFPRTNNVLQPTIDLTPYIIGEQQDQKRTDDAFALTTFSVMIPSNLFDYAGVNIPPFTLFSKSPNVEFHTATPPVTVKS